MNKKTPDLTQLAELSTQQLTDSLIEYPCEFPIKVFGQQNAGDRIACTPLRGLLSFCMV